MSAEFRIENPAAVQITLTCTLTLAEWREISRRLEGHGLEEASHIGYPLTRAIYNMTNQVTQAFYPKLEQSLGTMRTRPDGTLEVTVPKGTV